MSVSQTEFETAVEASLANITQLKTMHFDLPIRGVVDSSFDWVGTYRVIADDQTGDYATDFGGGNQHIGISVTAITTGGDIVITGTSISEASAVPNVADTETITIDATVSKYQSDKKWLEVTNIDVASGTIAGITYDIELVGYFDFGNSDWQIHGYRADMKTTSDTSDFAVILTKVQDEGDKKYSHVTIEKYGHDSLSTGGKFFDGIRTGASDRSATLSSNLAPNNGMICYKQLDYSTYFTNDENIFEGSKAEGLLIHVEGRSLTGAVGEVSDIDNVHLTMFYTHEDEQ